MSNTLNAITGLIPNELTYDFKVRDKLTAISKKINDKFMLDKKLKEVLNATRFKMCQEAFDAVFFANVKAKLIHDKCHKPLLLKEGNKVYLKLHKNYKLPRTNNRKLSNQRCGPFLVKRHVGRLVYKLELSPKWRVHSVISVTQLKLANEGDLYRGKRPNYPGSVEVEGNTDFEKSYEIKRSSTSDSASTTRS